MSDVVLYRKYRSKTFKEILGQEHITKVLEDSIKLGRVSHAYLFAGSRGTGKTSIARILAREIGTSPNDLYEIDAASNRGIDDIRAIRDAVNVLPFESKQKVYIVDEVHQLTKDAFNALLKTLEEPPAHVIFILATTEMGKLPETVISRCQVFQFKKPNQNVIKDLITRVAKSEGFSLEPASADLVSLLADGSFRDGLGILQKIISSSADKKITLAEVETVTGAPRGTLINRFIGAVAARRVDEALKAVAEAAEAGVLMEVFLKILLERLRFTLLLRYASDLTERIASQVSDDDFKLIRKLASEDGNAINADTLLEFLKAGDLIGYASIPELPVEIATIKVCGKIK